jgi:hypothetical protein
MLGRAGFAIVLADKLGAALLIDQHTGDLFRVGRIRETSKETQYRDTRKERLFHIVSENEVIRDLRNRPPVSRQDANHIRQLSWGATQYRHDAQHFGLRDYSSVEL